MYLIRTSDENDRLSLSEERACEIAKDRSGTVYILAIRQINGPQEVSAWLAKCPKGDALFLDPDKATMYCSRYYGILHSLFIAGQL